MLGRPDVVVAILRRLRDRSHQFTNPIFLRFMDVVTQQLGCGISTVGDDILHNIIGTVLMTHQWDVAALLAEEPPAAAVVPPPAASAASGSLPFESQFWKLAVTLFLNVCLPTGSGRDACNIIDDMVKLLESAEQLFSPSAVLALDVVVQRAVYELSDKIGRVAEAAEPSVTPRSTTPPNNIERCVSVMTHQVVPLCAKFQKYFNIAAPSVESPLHLGNRVQTLNRQLQELLAWTKYEGQNRVPQLFSKPTADGNGPRSARAHESSLHALDELLLTTLGETRSMESHIPHAVADAAGRRIAHLLSGQPGVALDLLPCGSMEMGLTYCEQGPELDWVSVVPDYCHQSPVRGNPDQRSANQTLVKRLETIVDIDVAAETAMKHLKACFKDFVNLVNTFADAVQSSVQDGQGMWGHGLAGRSLKFLRDDAESMVLAGEEFMSNFAQQKMGRLRSNVGIAQALSKMEEVTEALEKPDKERSSVAKKFSKAWEKPLRDAGFTQVRSITTKTRFFLLKFVGMYPSIRHPVASTVFVDTIVPLHATALLKYCSMVDTTGKVRAFLDLLRMYVKCHRICDPSAGFLSTFGWYVMALHMLVKFDYLPNLHGAIFTKAQAIVERGPVTLFEQTELPSTYLAKLHSTSLIELFDRFFRYYVEEFDVFSGAISLRDGASVLPKAEWTKSLVLWRLAVEDPFEAEHFTGAYDLGTTLSRSGQLTTFKALRRGVYGLFSIVVQGLEPARGNIKKLFSRTELIHLARKADYMGAIVLPPMAFARAAFSSHFVQSDAMTLPLDKQRLEVIETLQDELSSVVLVSPRVAVSMESAASSFGTPSFSLKKSVPQTPPTTGREEYSARGMPGGGFHSARGMDNRMPSGGYGTPQQMGYHGNAGAGGGGSGQPKYAQPMRSPRDPVKPPPYGHYPQAFTTTPDHAGGHNSARVSGSFPSMSAYVTQPPPEQGGAQSLLLEAATQASRNPRAKPFIPPIPLQSLLASAESTGAGVGVGANGNLSARGGGYYVGNSSARSESQSARPVFDRVSPGNTARASEGEDYLGNLSARSAQAMISPRQQSYALGPGSVRGGEDEFYNPFANSPRAAAPASAGPGGVASIGGWGETGMFGGGPPAPPGFDSARRVEGSGGSSARGMSADATPWYGGGGGSGGDSSRLYSGRDQGQGYATQGQGYGHQVQGYGTQSQGYGHQGQSYGNHQGFGSHQGYGQGYGNQGQGYGSQGQGYGHGSQSYANPGLGQGYGNQAQVPQGYDARQYAQPSPRQAYPPQPPQLSMRQVDAFGQLTPQQQQSQQQQSQQQHSQQQQSQSQGSANTTGAPSPNANGITNGNVLPEMQSWQPF